MRVRSANRSGKIMVLFAMLLPVMVGMMGLVLDSGLIMASHRQVQAAGDAAAVAAAVELLYGRSSSASTVAENYVKQKNGLANAVVVVNSPPVSGPYSGQQAYVEVLVTNPISTMFVQALGSSSSQTVKTRSVAGFESIPCEPVVACLERTGIPGLEVLDGNSLHVNGPVIVNSEGSGNDESYGWVNLGLWEYAVNTPGAAYVKATEARVVGGVLNPTEIQNYVSGNPSPLKAGTTPTPDPLLFMATPNASNGPNLTLYSETADNGFDQTSGNWTLSPGVYSYIWVRSTASVTFNPGIYILKATRSPALYLQGTGQATGTGVMFYNTGSTYLDNSAGYYDLQDEDHAPPAPDWPTFGSIVIDMTTVGLEGINNTSSPFHGMLIYQRRRNTQTIDIVGRSTAVFTGAVYAKWGFVRLYGAATFNNQFIVGRLRKQGAGTALVSPSATVKAKAIEVVLVE